MGGFQPGHWVVIIIVVVLLFGAKKMPDAARSLGKSLRILKAETRGLREDDVRAKAEAQTKARAESPKTAKTEPITGDILDADEAQAKNTKNTDN